MLFDSLENDNSSENQRVAINREKFFNQNKMDPSRLVNIWGVHGSEIYRVQEKDLGSGALDPKTRIKNYDGLIADLKNSYLMITSADCFPIFFFDRRRGAMGTAHCGWRGILAGLASKMITEFRKNFNSIPSDLDIWIGPGIKNCHFEVKQDVVELFEDKYPNEIIFRNNSYYIDLPAIIKRQLVESGVRFNSITEHPDCTFCEKDKYFSYRRDKPTTVKAKAFIIHLK